VTKRGVLTMVAGAALVAALAGCSDDGGKSEDPSAGASSATSSATTATPSAEPTQPPTFAESDTCRTKMAPLVDTMLANATNNLSYDTFHARFEEIDRKLDNALLACSNAVARPATRVRYEYSLVNLAWGLCTQKNCATDLIAKHIRKGNDLARKVKDQIELTT